MRNERRNHPEYPALSEFVRSSHARASSIVLLGISILLTQISLFNYLGYEFSVVVALTMSVISGLVTIGLFRKSFEGAIEVRLIDFLIFQKSNLYINLILLALPLIVVTVNLLAVKNCSYGEGLLFFGLIPVVTVLFSVTLATLCSILFTWSRTVYSFTLLVVGLVHPLWLGYFTPQIHSYNFLYGFFPGFSYDEVLTITPTLILFRVITVLLSLSIFLFASLLINQIRGTNRLIEKLVSIKKIFSTELSTQKIFLIALLVIMVCVWVFRIELGFESSLSAIRSELGGVYRTEHFAIYYSKDSYSDEGIRWVAAEHEFRLRQVAERLQVSLRNSIASYIYPSEESKREFIGTGTTAIAKPWRYEIHLNRDSWQRVLKHELVHVLAGEFGVPVIHASLSTGLLEGLAMAVEWEFGNRTLHEYAAAMKRFGLMRDVSSLMSLTGFAAQPSTVSYVLCGSFCRFLIDRYGMVRFEDVYRGRSFSRVYEKDLAQLVGEWKDFLTRIPVPDDWISHVKFYFDRKSIFTKECARYIARLNNEAMHHLRRKSFAQAMQLYAMSLEEHWNSEAFAGMIQTAYTAGRYEKVVQLIDDVSSNSVRSENIRSLSLLYGDALWSKGEILSSREAYVGCRALDISESLNDAASIRIEVLDDPMLRYGVHSVFLDSRSDSDKLSLLAELEKKSSNPIVSLIKANVLFRMEDFDNARKVLEGRRMAARNPSFADNLNAAREKLLGICSFRLGNFQQARAKFWQAMNFTTNEAAILRLHDWIDRCEWFAEHGSRYLASHD